MTPHSTTCLKNCEWTKMKTIQGPSSFQWIFGIFFHYILSQMKSWSNNWSNKFSWNSNANKKWWCPIFCSIQMCFYETNVSLQMSPKQPTITNNFFQNNNVAFKLKGPHLGTTWFQIWTKKNMTMRNKRGGQPWALPYT